MKINPERVTQVVDKYIENHGFTPLQAIPSIGLRAAAENPNYSRSIFGSPAQTLYGISVLSAWNYNRQAQLLFDESDYYLKYIMLGYPLVCQAEVYGKWKGVVSWLGRSVVNDGLNGYYGWLQDKGQPHSELKNWLAIGYLRMIKNCKVPIDPIVSLELSRVDEVFGDHNYLPLSDEFERLTV